MVYLVATISAIVTGALLALGVRMLTGVEHQGILFAVGIIGGGIQWLILLSWYLYVTRSKQALAREHQGEL